MEDYMEITYTASWIIILVAIIIVVAEVIATIAKIVISYKKRKYGCVEVDEFEDLETANEAYNRLFMQYENLFDQNNRLIAEKTALERKCRRWQNTCEDFEAENTRLKGEREQGNANDPKVCGYGHIEQSEE